MLNETLPTRTAHLFDEDFQQLRGDRERVEDSDGVPLIEALWKRHTAVRERWPEWRWRWVMARSGGGAEEDLVWCLESSCTPPVSET